jgi:hypothetical protein
MVKKEENKKRTRIEKRKKKKNSFTFILDKTFSIDVMPFYCIFHFLLFQTFN